MGRLALRLARAEALLPSPSPKAKGERGLSPTPEPTVVRPFSSGGRHNDTLNPVQQ
jgi:hypothetical protein